MTLPVQKPVLPMLAKKIDALPKEEGCVYEPKWDGFRAIVFKDRDDVYLQSRDSKPLGRYFPELIEVLQEQLPERCVLDGEVVIVTPQGLSFDLLQLRLHPAASRVKKLAAENPSSMVFFDLLAEGDEDLMARPFAERRGRLEKLLADVTPPLHVTPATTDRAVAEDWFARFEGAGFDGVMAKPLTSAYEPNKRTMFKIKHARECDCVVAGFRWHKDGQGTKVGSLLLGLYDDQNRLNHVGVVGAFADAKRKELVSFLAPYREGAAEIHPWREWGNMACADGTEQRMPGAPSRWNAGKDLTWEPLRPELVVEVAYDHMQGDRFRHTAQFRRWRQDKEPADCTYAQLEVVAPEELAKIFKPVA